MKFMSHLITRKEQLMTLYNRCDKCKKTPDGDLWEVLVTDGLYCYECACILEYEKAV